MHVKIWSKDHCPYCVMAVKACDQLSDILDDFEYEVVKLGVDFEVEDFTNEFMYAKSLPQIKVDGRHVGGWSPFKEIVTTEIRNYDGNIGSPTK